jgi:hypothetical protein
MNRLLGRWLAGGVAIALALQGITRERALAAEGSPEAARVFAMLKSHAADSDPTYGADSYLLTLTDSQQLEVARRLSTDKQTAYANYGVKLLVRLKHADEAVEPTARLLLDGKDINGLFWTWRNYDDPCLTDSIRLQLGRYLVGRYDKLHRAEKQRAEGYLAGAGADRAAGKFQLSNAEADLRSIEARMQRNLCPAPSLP